MIKARENKLLAGAPPSADLLVCFPSRARLTLMPKPICSPSRPSDPIKRNHHLKRINTRAAGGSTAGPNSPLMWGKNNQMRQEIAEPTSPKVTCAGQIKVRNKSSAACRNWQSVMEEIERIHNRGKNKKKSKWVENFGFKKDVMNFLTCLRNIRFDFRCFGGFPNQTEISSDDEDEDEEDEDDEFDIGEDMVTKNSNDDDKKSAVFSKWFMVLQENKGNDISKISKQTFVLKEEDTDKDKDEDDESAPAVPPPNALLLMRCRSAPAKSWMEEKREQEQEDEQKQIGKVEEEKKHRRRESLGVLMKYDTDFYNLSSEIAQETWIVGDFQHHFSRSTSWRR
ncbi:uncharacterized protein LOC130811211 [Amaranthus tricolor]|uniref:uncharacterized protein LOC130811211 n=1 Tax=Amaranthus tricolor TaxID=29722 RepID=UPI002583A8A7|nr:uncharacterized protein LOC130811211 [Amaranthus tricolor]